MKSKTKVRLNISGFESKNHDDITALLDTKPSVILKKGERSKYRGMKTRKLNRWSYAIEEPLNPSFPEISIKQMTSYLIEKEVELTEVLKESSGTVSISAHLYSVANPGFYFNIDLLKVMGRVGLELDIDLYSL